MNNKPPKSTEWDLRINFQCNQCGSFQSKANELISHAIEKHCGNKFYKCFLCQTYSSDKKVNLFQHYKDKHNFPLDFIACPLCFKNHAKDEGIIESHIIRDHWTVEQVNCCRLCTYKCENDISQHIQKVHKGISCSIPGCSVREESPAAMFQHILSCHFPIVNVYYNCPYCDFTFGSEEALDQHSRDKHGVERTSDDENDVSVDIICTLCDGYKCEKKETFIKHMKAKHTLHVLICPFNPCVFSSEQFWKFCEHVSDEHISKITYDCPKCGAKFPLEHSLKQHIDNKHLTDLQPICYCEFIVGSAKEHIEEVHGLIMEQEICRLCDSKVRDSEFHKHMIINHGINFPRGIEELYDDD